MKIYYETKPDELIHYGIPGMKWGVRRAKYENKKVDRSFKKWKKNDEYKNKAIELGKNATDIRMAVIRDPSNKQLKKNYQTAQKEYKRALRKNTTYRKGSVRQEVGKDFSRKLLSESKKIKKQLGKDPNNKELKNLYEKLSDMHEVERYKARRAQEVGLKRSVKKASVKRAATTTIKAAAISTAIVAGASVVNKYLNKHDVTLNGKKINLSTDHIRTVADIAKRGKDFMGFFY